MMASPRPFVPTTQPSKTVVKAAQNAAGSQHAQINLIRLIKSLEKLDPSLEITSINTRRKDWETVQYARVLLDTLTQSKEGSSNSSTILSELNGTLKGVEMRFRHAASIPSPLAVIAPALAVPLPDSPSSTTPSAAPSIHNDSAAVETVKPPPQAAVLRQRHLNVDNYLRSRLSEGREGDEAGLLPLKVAVRNAQKEKDGRDDLLGGGNRPGIGSAQLHEELGGQLADMSHRLKLNAVHFANSLESEKSLLDTSTDVLEKNLSSTRSSKKNLSSVSSKGKGTTCMTLGIVLVVLIIFVWTYMLIRFT